MPFDVEGALKAGASEDDVLAHLSKTRKFDVGGALKAGASKRQIIDHMAGMSVASAQPAPDSAPAPTSFAGGVPTPQSIMGLGHTVADLAGGARAGLMSTMMGARDFLAPKRSFAVGDRTFSAGGGMLPPTDSPQGQALAQAPDSTAGQVGRIAEGVAEFAVPLSKIGKASKALSFGKRAAIEGLAGGEVAALQSGGDPAAIITGTALGGAIPAVGAAAGGAARLVKRAAEGAQEGGVGGATAALIRRVSESDPVDMMFRAIKPRNVKITFRSALKESLPELKASEAALGKPIETADDLLAAAKDAKQRIWKAREDVIGPARAMGTKVDGNVIADAMERSIPAKLKLENPGAVKQIREQIATYRRQFDIAEAEQLWHDTNAELSSFYSKFPGAQRAALVKDPQAALLDAQGEAWRNAIEGALGDSGQGPGARELARRYGKLMEVEGELQRRVNVASRQQPESLSEQMGAWSGAGDIARGAWSLSRGDLKGMADIAAGHAKREGAKFLKEQQTTDALIRRAMSSVKDAPAPYPAYTPPKIAGLLEAGPIRMPSGPDATKMTVTTGPPLQPKTPTPRGLLEAGPRQMPPVPDTSGVRAAPAKSR